MEFGHAHSNASSKRSLDVEYSSFAPLVTKKETHARFRLETSRRR